MTGIQAQLDGALNVRFRFNGSEFVMDAFARPVTPMARRRPESLEKIKRSARRLFVERGYHATRPQDIARDAGVGHGTFYLHYEDKRTCFLAFVDDARAEYYAFMQSRTGRCDTIEETITRTLTAIYEYADANPGILCAAMADDALIDAEGPQCGSLIQRWGRDWAQTLRDGVGENQVIDLYDPDIVGQAIVGAIHQCRLEGDRVGFAREAVIGNLARFLGRALRP
jgi:AcrR family transcriptional regulator